MRLIKKKSSIGNMLNGKSNKVFTKFVKPAYESVYINIHHFSSSR